MRREEKEVIIDNLAQRLDETKHFYLTDISSLDAEQTSNLRRKCFEKDISLLVVKNTLLRQAMEKCEGDFNDLYDILKDSTSIMFCETGNIPAKLIKEFRKTMEKPLLKAAFVEESIYIGDDQLDALSNIKSKDELLGDLLMLLQSPATNLVSALASSSNKMAGALLTLSEKEN
ncbi:MAG: 50S ribosomal protein L10 [Bacteroidetes bacterium]|nr:MAG: 50S ribosomal protein L10 [Bacteroidota bacterium]RLD72440.1 MAG: 50S ribosomal protein L10 [Bacteroidota bacterium]RLD88581.1 MAG: 50S ribosomal protein L10 [Bacteroidota bacterium]